MLGRIGTTIARLLMLLAAWGLATSPALAASRPRPLQSTAEWRRMADLWQTMLDHSSEVIYSPARFQQLATSMDAMDSDVAALAKLGQLPAGLGEDLKALFHDRYQYIQTRHYTSESQITLSASEAASATAHWIIELQLAAIRRASSDPQANRALIAGASGTIAYELSFLSEYRRLEEGAAHRRQALADRQAAGEAVDPQAFDNDCQRRRILLLEAYRDKRVRISRSVQALMPHILALTTARPAPSVETITSPVPGL